MLAILVSTMHVCVEFPALNVVYREPSCAQAALDHEDSGGDLPRFFSTVVLYEEVALMGQLSGDAQP